MLSIGRRNIMSRRSIRPLIRAGSDIDARMASTAASVSAYAGKVARCSAGSESKALEIISSESISMPRPRYSGRSLNSIRLSLTLACRFLLAIVSTRGVRLSGFKIFTVHIRTAPIVRFNARTVHRSTFSNLIVKRAANGRRWLSPVCFPSAWLVISEYLFRECCCRCYCCCRCVRLCGNKPGGVRASQSNGLRRADRPLFRLTGFLDPRSCGGWR